MNYSARLSEIVDLLTPAEQALRELQVAMAVKPPATDTADYRVARGCRLISTVINDLRVEASLLAPPKYEEGLAE